MSFAQQVEQCLARPSEDKLIQLIKARIDTQQKSIKAKESAILGLADFYVDQKKPELIKEIAIKYSDYFQVFSKPRMAKIVKNLIDYIARVENSEKEQIKLCEYLIQWCDKEKRTYLKNRIQLKLSSLFLAVDEPSKSMAIIEPILYEVKKADDKLLLVELHLLESKINYKIKNYAKAKASLTASRANSNNVYCQPSLIAEIDLMSGTLYSQEQDYKTAYSYFYEALDPLIGGNDPRAIACFKYMLLCKIMNNSKEDLNTLLNGKYGLKYSMQRGVTAMKETADAHFSSSIVSLTKVLAQFPKEVNEDQIIKTNIGLLYDQLLQKNLFKIIQSYTQIDIEHISKKVAMSQKQVERKLSEMILDKKIIGTLDQSRGCLLIYHEQKQQKLYGNSTRVIENLLGVVERLSEATRALKKAE